MDTRQSRRVILIGSSTGGPPVIHTILKALPSGFPIPILIAQHMNGDFIGSFIEWLNEQCKLNVKQAVSGEALHAGTVYIPPKNRHITLEGETIRLLPSNEKELYVPSVARLFASPKSRHANEVIAILLSGMGSDGAAEITQLRQAGALTVAQDERSSIVFGMAGEAVKLGGIEFILPPDEIVNLLLGIHNRRKQ
jgi:two-component system chemotaxis response regulator CheB